MSVSQRTLGRQSRGLTLIEVMVTLVILLLGLLGLSGLIVKAGRASYEAYERQQALAIANDLAERMRANQAAGVVTPANSTIAGMYAAQALPGSPLGDPLLAPLWTSLQNGKIKDCAAVSCTATELVSYDLATWEGLLIGAARSNAAKIRIGGIGNGRGCVEGPLPAPGMDPTWIVSMSTPTRDAELFLFRGPHAEITWVDLGLGTDPAVHIEGYDALTAQSVTGLLDRLLGFVNGQ